MTSDDIGCDFRHQPRRLNRAVELVLEDIPGGGVVEKTDFKTTSLEMKEGSLLGVDSNGVYHLTKTAEAWEAAASGATEIKITSNNEFKRGEYLIDTPKAGTSREILSIENTNRSYDTLTLDAALGIALKAGDVLIQSATSGVTGEDAEYKYPPVAVAANPVSILASNTGARFMNRGTVKESLMPYPVDATIKAMMEPLIRFV